MKNKLITFAIIFMVILANLGIVQAATTATATLKTDKDKVKPGDTFTVTLSVECLDGINGIDTTYSYDSDKLELVSASVKDSTNWSSLGANNQITVICNSTSKITTADIYVLTFKVKNAVKAGTTANISTTDILVDSDAATDSEKTVKALNISITVENESSNNGSETTGSGSETEKTDNKPQNTQTPAGTTQGTNTKNSTPKTNIDNTVVKTSNLPKTGKGGVGVAFIVIIAIAILGVVAYKKYDNYKGI